MSEENAEQVEKDVGFSSWKGFFAAQGQLIWAMHEKYATNREKEDWGFRAIQIGIVLFVAVLTVIALKR